MYSLRAGGGRAFLLLRGRLARPPLAVAQRCSACHTAAEGARANRTATKPVNECYLVLERAVAARAGVDRELWHGGRFNAQVYPDLPVAGSWPDLLSSLMSRKSQSSDTAVEQDRMDGRLLVQTVACQVRGRAGVRRRLQQAAQDGAGAVLCLSGSHPAHRLAAAAGWSPTSFELLRTAAGMRRAGELPQCLELWAVENPLVNRADRLEQKLEAGASVVLTQPPLLWERFAVWWADAHRRGLTRQARLVVGVPMLTSPGNARFWLQLCGAGGLEGAGRLAEDFRAAEARGKAELAAFSQAYNRALIERVLGLPGVAGLHIMPLTKPGRSQVLALQAGGTIPQPL